MPESLILPKQFEPQAQRLRQEIISRAEMLNLDSLVVVAAIADVLATVAVTLDRTTGQRTLADRLHSFNERVEQTYHRTHKVAQEMSGEAARK